MIEIIIKNADNINQAAREFITFINNKTVFAFEGSMGVGKTTFIKAICEELGVTDVINSPTFSIVNEYKIKNTHKYIYHFDFYRINNINEAIDIGIEDYFYSGNLCFIEWPEQVKELLPDDTVFITIQEQANHSRCIVI